MSLRWRLDIFPPLGVSVCCIGRHPPPAIPRSGHNPVESARSLLIDADPGDATDVRRTRVLRDRTNFVTSETSQERVSPLLRLLQPGARHEHVFVVCNPRARVVEELVNAKGQDDVVIVFGSPWARRRALALVRKAGLATAEVLARGQAGAGEIVSRHAAALSFSFRRAEPSSWK